jgi:hypothetical protein
MSKDILGWLAEGVLRVYLRLLPVTLEWPAPATSCTG